ncbi:GNAT family N-acetyltransferase [Alphaproteobacteria bacterium GH1-50]|uniref:GNAT family N-acetyltransferase n=1 Tax=Kangsaoukella pontilimi TaxID=2691042 RepID=A0A7C9IS26_9RHOB|nr:bifunctional UDP-2,4-diacetamido-2,4,6-trideoxy-beta-L-altropyranose hydrolase/GNAT family N-acetyltransferase [Kangsaoukella pontilimi]MXQ09363.1 GNAT family N-acetyltransferase [Kangsaoukella pontilimi]
MSRPIRIAIHAVAGHAIGTGHFGRSAAVSDALARHPGVEVTLITAPEGEPLARAYFGEGPAILALPDTPDMPVEALGRLSPDALFLDRYGVARDWEHAAAHAGVPLMALDDLAEARDADVILRILPEPDAPKGPRSRVFEGPAWLPLSDHVARRTAPRPVNERAERLNICFGGTDPTGETLPALAALANMTGLTIDAVIGPGTAIDAEALARFGALDHINLHHAPSQADLAALLASADMALGAGGVMLWERLAMGVPSLVITAADNQRPQVSWASERGAIRWLGHHGEVSGADISHAVVTLAADPDARRTMAETGQRIVDGRGAVRIAAALRAMTLTARPVTRADARALYDWRTDEANWRYNRSDADRPAFDDHCRWLDRRLADPDCVFRVIEDRGTPVGVVRFDRVDDTATLSIYLVPEAHGRRLGLPVYMAGEAALVDARPDVRRVTSAIHRENSGSVRLHKDAGFTLSEADDPDWYSAEKRL